METLNFSMPQIGVAAMSKQDQIDVTVNQATAAIICCYLEHCNTAINKGIVGATSTSGGPTATIPSGTSVGFIDVNELTALINNVQAALKAV